jgi:ribosomal protein S27AE
LKICARAKLYYAVKKGIVTRPSICDKCGCSGHIEAHHTDYTKPLEVVWLCKRCHSETRRVSLSSVLL